MVALNTLIGLTVAVGCTVLYFILGNKKKPGLPPGPKGLPLLGNLRDLPKSGEREYEVWTKHKELYGPISSLRILGQTIIVINSADLAMELLEKRATVSYSRPSMVFAGEMCGWNKIMMFQAPRRLRAYRRHFHNIIGSQSSLVNFMPLLETEVKRFLVRVLANPDDLLQHVRTEAGAIILKLTYGYDIEPRKQDPLIKLAEDAMGQFSNAAAPGAWIVDLVPACKMWCSTPTYDADNTTVKYLPDWMPGSDFKRTARLWQKTFLKLGNVPMRFAQRQMKAEHREPSFVSSVYEKSDGHMTVEEEDVATWSAASMYAGGADTSVSSMQLFFLAMSIHTEFQRKAQAEIDHVIGIDRLPTLADRSRLPYVSALVSEVLRWHVIAPLGLPHVTTAKSTIGGYRIPGDSIIIPNIWLFAHDSETYKQPMDFRPERFLGDSPERDPRDFVFGFGRRVCPGRALADSSVWLTVAMSLAALVIEKGVNEKGNVIEPEVKFTPGVISHPVPFKTSIRARSERYAELVKEVEKTHLWVEGMSEKLEGLDE